MRLWLFISTLVVFAAGAAAGFFVAQAWGPGGGPERGGRNRPDDELSPLPLLRSGEVLQSLELSDVQRQMIAHQLEVHQKRVQEYRDKFAELREEVLKGVYTALLPSQQDKLDEIQRDRARNEIRLYWVSREMVRLRQELALNPEQTPRVEDILVDYWLKKRELSSFRRGCSPAERPAREDELRQWRTGELANVLSPEQLAKYNELKSQQRRGPPGGGPVRGKDSRVEGRFPVPPPGAGSPEGPPKPPSP